MAVFLVANTTLYINELFGVPNGKCMLLMQEYRGIMKAA